MNVFEILAIILTVTAIFAYINERFIKLPTPIGVTLVGLIISLGLVIFKNEFLGLWAANFLASLNFNEIVMGGMLSFLLFAGSLTVNLDNINKQKWPILTLATLGVIMSTFIVGTLTFYGLALFGIHLPYLYALLFGALISPTDPIAVLSILRKVGVPKGIETLITGESLFNDGVGVVVFSVILSLLGAGHGSGHEAAGSSGVMAVATLFAQEAVGGIFFGMAIGLIAYYLLKSIDEYSVEILITLALVTGGYALASHWHTSGPLAMVVAGIFIGNQGRLFAMSERTREHIDTFWEVVDEILNMILFVLIGLEVIIVHFDAKSLLIAVLAIPLVLLGRFISVSVPISLMRLRKTFLPYTIRMMVWGGLRGGISIALALSLPAGEERDLIIKLTYAVVVFSILIQGLTIGKVAARIPTERIE